MFSENGQILRQMNRSLSVPLCLSALVALKLLGDALSRWLDVSAPGSFWGFLILLLALSGVRDAPGALSGASEWLLNHLTLFLLPSLVPMLLGLLVASALSVGGVLLTGGWLGTPWDLTVAVAPKAATMPVALKLVAGDTVHQAVAVAAVFLTGLFGALLAPLALRGAGVVDDRVHAFVLGVSAHAIGLVRAQALHPAHLDLAVAGMCGNALVTALLCTALLCSLLVS